MNNKREDNLIFEAYVAQIHESMDPKAFDGLNGQPFQMDGSRYIVGPGAGSENVPVNTVATPPGPYDRSDELQIVYHLDQNEMTGGVRGTHSEIVKMPLSQFQAAVKLTPKLDAALQQILQAVEVPPHQAAPPTAAAPPAAAPPAAQ